MNKKIYLYHTMDKDNVIYLNNDETWYKSLFNRHYKALVNYGVTFTKSYEEAEDIVQSVYLDLWKDRNKIEKGEHVKSFLYKGVYFKCLNKIKHAKVVEKFHATLPKHQMEVEDKVVSQELTANIQRAIEELPQQCRKIFSLSRFENKKYKEIAQELSISPKTVENQMGKALKSLRIALSEFLYFLILIIHSI